jgi:hypothetical protein
MALHWFSNGVELLIAIAIIPIGAIFLLSLWVIAEPRLVVTSGRRKYRLVATMAGRDWL